MSVKREEKIKEDGNNEGTEMGEKRRKQKKKKEGKLLISLGWRCATGASERKRR